MPVNIDDIKKLPNEEKLKIIDELWGSIEDDWEQRTNVEEESPEVIALLEERLEKYEKGEMNSYTWEEVKSRIEANLEQQRRATA
jgi:putative addiction module component (TIGR02574 family)